MRTYCFVFFKFDVCFCSRSKPFPAKKRDVIMKAKNFSDFRSDMKCSIMIGATITEESVNSFFL